MNPAVVAVAVFATVSCIALRYLYRRTSRRFSRLQSKCDTAWRDLLESLGQQHDAIRWLLDALSCELPFEAHEIRAVEIQLDRATMELERAMDASSHQAQLQTVVNAETVVQHATERLLISAEEQCELGGKAVGAIREYELSRQRVLDKQLAHNDVVMIFNAFRRSPAAAIFAKPLGYVRDRETIVLGVSTAPEVAYDYAMA